MAMGLSSDELMNVFFQSSQRRMELLQSMIEGAKTGENPRIKEIVDRFVRKTGEDSSNVSNAELLAGMSSVLVTAVYAVMDVIATNNSEVEKSVQRGERQVDF